jgi:hypothetical protein
VGVNVRLQSVAQKHGLAHLVVVDKLPYASLAADAVVVLSRVADVVLRDGLFLAVCSKNRRKSCKLKPSQVPVFVRSPKQQEKEIVK